MYILLWQLFSTHGTSWLKFMLHLRDSVFAYLKHLPDTISAVNVTASGRYCTLREFHADRTCVIFTTLKWFIQAYNFFFSSSMLVWGVGAESKTGFDSDRGLRISFWVTLKKRRRLWKTPKPGSLLSSSSSSYSSYSSSPNEKNSSPIFESSSASSSSESSSSESSLPNTSVYEGARGICIVGKAIPYPNWVHLTWAIIIFISLHIAIWNTGITLLNTSNLRLLRRLWIWEDFDIIIAAFIIGKVNNIIGSRQRFIRSVVHYRITDTRMIRNSLISFTWKRYLSSSGIGRSRRSAS